MTQHHFASIEDAREFMFAGNALLTLESLKTGVHFSYKIKLATEKPGFSAGWWVYLLTEGSADDGTFRYLGFIQEGAFRLTKGSCAGAEAPSVKAFQFFMSLSELHPQLVIRHEGKCGRCGRTLTVPESIDRGIGPECWAQIGGAQ